MLDRRNSTFRHVNNADVRLTLAGEKPFACAVYLTIGQRLSDLLNDERGFLPVRRETGEVVMIAKAQIVSIAEIAAMSETVDFAEDDASAKARGGRSFDPYATLRVSPDASIEQIRAAYKSRMKAVHPDAIAALGLDEDLSRAALLVAQRVNYAYQKLMREREEAQAETAGATA